MRVLQIGADRSKRGILFRGTPAFKRQEAYANGFGNLDIIGFSLKSDGANKFESEPLRVYPTNSSSKLGMLFDALRLARSVRKPDVVSAQDPFETGFVAWLIARRLKVPLHVQVHTDFLSPEYARLNLVNRFRVLLAGLVLRRADGVRVVSDRIKRSLETKYRLHVPITVLPIFVDVEKFQNAEPLTDFSDDRITNSAYKILVVSRDAPEKNIGLAIAAFRKAAPRTACLILIGDFDVDYVRAEDRVFGMARSDPERFYKSADLVLVPSKYEGYGLVIVEALAAGKPVLSTDVGIAREAGAIVTSEEHFANALTQWFESGPRTGELKNYPYRNFDEYVRAYCADIEACVKP